MTGDHGQAFGDPHDGYMQGRSVYEEDVNVPLLLWYSAAVQAAARSATIGSHVDLAPTIARPRRIAGCARLAGAQPVRRRRAFPRAYFYVAEDHFTLGVREENWKYIFDLREGVEELYDLSRDPTEQREPGGSRSPSAARGCVSGWPPGRTPTAVSTTRCPQ